MLNLCRLLKKICIAFTVASMLFLIGCAAGLHPSGQVGELWKGSVTGDAKGSIEISVYEVKDQEGVYSISGFIKAEVIGGGVGQSFADLRLRGSIVNGVVKTRLSGTVGNAVRTTSASGQAVGTMGETNASGDYTVTESEMGQKFSGVWTLEKVR